MAEKKPLNIDEIHAGTLEIIKKLSNICKGLNINYYVGWGSLIGAIRHKGFVPWDDDFDVIMLRPDYDKFVKYCEEHEEELYPFKILNRQVCKEYPYVISRFEDMRYKAVYDNLIEYDSGMFIDIYPFDGAGRDEVKIRKKIEKKKRILAKFVGWSINNKFVKPQSQNPLTVIFKYIGFKISHLLGKDFFLDRFEKLKGNYSLEDSTLVGCLCWDYYLYVFDKRLFEDSLTVPFENITVKIPVGYDEFLKIAYGDYMTLPPENERKASHGYTIYKR